MNSTMLSNVVFISSRMSLMTASIVICFKNLTLFSLFRLCIQSDHNGWRRRAMICYLSSKMFSKVVFVFSRMTLMKPPGGDSHFMDLISPECEEEKTSSRLEKQTFRVMARRASRVCTHFSNGVSSRSVRTRFLIKISHIPGFASSPIASAFLLRASDFRVSVCGGGMAAPPPPPLSRSGGVSQTWNYYNGLTRFYYCMSTCPVCIVGQIKAIKSADPLITWYPSPHPALYIYTTSVPQNYRWQNGKVWWLYSLSK